MTYFVEGVTRVGVDDSHVERIGEYSNLQAAIAAAKQAIDESLMSQLKDGMSAARLFIQYQSAGRVPFIFSDADTTINVAGFNHLEFAMRRCEAICKQKTSA
ncbi:MAG: hypothetical protein JWN94_782 [Betaproteobacteria bacterium]|jgi:hypothetical protein|nr:hypothetical protein [Betaproteobacteria bacterium]